jgi:hypothetical protein
MALAVGAGLVRVRVHTALALEHFYFGEYAKSEVFGDLSAPHLRNKPQDPRKPFAVVFVGKYPANEPLFNQPNGPVTVQIMMLEPKAFHKWIKDAIYRGKSLQEWLLWQIVGTGILALLLVGGGAYLDREHDREARNGRHLRGPRLVSRWRFNRETKGGGLAIWTTDRRNPLELVRGKMSKALRIRREVEAHHVQIAGDAGSGKSSIIRQILCQVEQMDEVAIVLDPDREYVREFYDRSRGDWILNPKDERCPYWHPGDEAEDEAEATPVAMALFPEDPTAQKFFLQHTRAIFAYLLATYHPTCAELSYWMAHPEEIDIRVANTEHAHTLTENAAPQRAGILGSLNEAGKPLRMMPAHDEGRRSWTARGWANERKGWIFVTSTPDTLDAVLPLQSMWLDMLLLKLQSVERKPDQPRTWVVLDELASLKALPQLTTALTKQRKSGNPIVLGFQGVGQLVHRYGEKQTEVITSQAFTNIVLRTREPKAAERLSALIGKVEVERAKENRPAHLVTSRRGRNYSTERVTAPLVMDSEIQGLPDLRGYFVQQDKVVKFGFRPLLPRVRAEALIERTITPFEWRPADAEDVARATKAAAIPVASGAVKEGRKANEVKRPQEESFDVGLFGLEGE